MSFILSLITLVAAFAIGWWWKGRLAQGQAEEFDAQVQTIFDSLQDGIVLLDRDQNIVRINQVASRLLGLTKLPVTRQEVAGRFEVTLPDGSTLPPDQWPGVRASSGDLQQNQVLRLRRTDTGAEVFANVSTYQIRNRYGQLTHILISYLDVTQPTLMEESRHRLAAIVESSEDAIVGKDEHGIVTSWNGGAEKVFGYKATEMIGASIKRLIPEDRLNEEDEILGRIKRGETVEHIETIRRKKNGQLIHVSLTVSPIRDSRGVVVGASKIARNITDRKNLERQLYQSQKMEAIGQLTGGIAHDFNNLLAVIIGNLDLLERMEGRNEVALKRVHTAQKASLRGADLTRRLLTLSSNEDLSPKAVDLNRSVQNVMDLASRVLGADIRISLNLDDSAPWIFADAAGLESALLNLIVNARDAMPRGGTLTVTTQLSGVEGDYAPVQMGELKAGRYACVTVSDTGHGMTREVLDRVFEPFFTTKPRGKGTGLGLAMAYGFCKQSSGTVRIYSEPGLGTTVSFYLPLAKDGSAAVRVEPTHVPAIKSGETVLVVDDEIDLLEIAAVFLQDLGYRAVTAKDGASAVAMLESRKDIDLLVTDIVMAGGMNGVELAHQARAMKPGIKVIYCSGFPAASLADQKMTHLDGPLLHKPYSRNQFAALIRSVMEKDDVQADEG